MNLNKLRSVRNRILRFHITIVLSANPPFSLQDLGAENWVSDPYGRNIAGVPPQSNGDMAWVQHMIKSMNSTGRMRVVLPHGVQAHVQQIDTWQQAYLDVEKVIENNLPSVEEALADLKKVWNESMEVEEKLKKILKYYI